MNNDELTAKVVEIDQRSKTNETRINELAASQGRLQSLVTSMEVMAMRIGNVEEAVSEIKSDVKYMTSKPGKRWDTVVEKVVLLIVAAMVGYVCVKLGLQ